jgi:hypothetical protein
VKALTHCGKLPLMGKYADGTHYIMCLKCGYTVEAPTAQEALDRWNSGL